MDQKSSFGKSGKFPLLLNECRDYRSISDLFYHDFHKIRSLSAIVEKTTRNHNTHCIIGDKFNISCWL